MSAPESTPTASVPGTFALIGPGRAGITVATALIDAGWVAVGVAGRAPDAPSVVAAAARLHTVPGTAAAVVAAASLVVIATPDAAIGDVAIEIAEAVAPSALVVHLSGAVALAALDDVVSRIGAMHPLQSMPSSEPRETRVAGSELHGAWCATAGDPEVDAIARSLGMIPFPVTDADRAGYHAAACIASNHLVALMAQVAACTTVPLEAFLPLARTTLDNVAELGPRAALTGPVARGDLQTVRAHLDAIPARERAAYIAMARRAAVLAGRGGDFNDDLDGVLA